MDKIPDGRQGAASALTGLTKATGEAMAKAGKKDTSPESDWIPSGYIDVTVLAQECGIDKVRNDLFSGQRRAFKQYKTRGGLDLIERGDWCTDEAGRWLKGEYPPDDFLSRHQPPFRVIVQVGPPPVTGGVYLPPFMVLMLAAIRRFNIGEETPWPKKSELEQYFRAQRLPDGKPISLNQASYLATFCRPLAAMSGGNKRGV
jgi:hypothetical protein